MNCESQQTSKAFKLMKEFFEYIAANPIVIPLGAIIPLIAMYHFYRKASAIKFAEWIAEEGQYELLPEEHLDVALKDAEQSGTIDSFHQLLSLVRKNYGHNEVKVGHLYWIWEQIELGISVDNIDSVPKFDKS